MMHSFGIGIVTAADVIKQAIVSACEKTDGLNQNEKKP